MFRSFIILATLLVISSSMAKASSQDSAFFLAVTTNDLVTVENLSHASNFDANTKTCFYGGSALIEAVMRSEFEIAKVLLENGASVNHQDGEGQTALMKLVKLPAATDSAIFAKEFYLLKKHSASMDIADSLGYTPLMYAVMSQNYLAVKLLVQNGADLNSKSKHKETALMHAASLGNGQIVALLLSHGANADIEDDAGKTALDLAQEYGDNNLAMAIYKKMRRK